MTRRDLLSRSSILLAIPLSSALGIPFAAVPDPPPDRHDELPHPKPETKMIVVRDIFQCKPGKARALADTFQKAIPILQKEAGLRNSRVLVDLVSDYWTVVWESEAPDLNTFEKGFDTYSSNAEIRQIMQGYMDNVEGGRREIYRVYTPA